MKKIFLLTNIMILCCGIAMAQNATLYLESKAGEFDLQIDNKKVDGSKQDYYIVRNIAPGTHVLRIDFTKRGNAPLVFDVPFYENKVAGYKIIQSGNNFEMVAIALPANLGLVETKEEEEDRLAPHKGLFGTSMDNYASHKFSGAPVTVAYNFRRPETKTKKGTADKANVTVESELPKKEENKVAKTEPKKSKANDVNGNDATAANKNPKKKKGGLASLFEASADGSYKSPYDGKPKEVAITRKTEVNTAIENGEDAVAIAKKAEELKKQQDADAAAKAAQFEEMKARQLKLDEEKAALALQKEKDRLAANAKKMQEQEAKIRAEKEAAEKAKNEVAESKKAIEDKERLAKEAAIQKAKDEKELKTKAAKDELAKKEKLAKEAAKEEIAKKEKLAKEEAMRIAAQKRDEELARLKASQEEALKLAKAKKIEEEEAKKQALKDAAKNKEKEIADAKKKKEQEVAEAKRKKEQDEREAIAKAKKEREEEAAAAKLRLKEEAEAAKMASELKAKELAEEKAKQIAKIKAEQEEADRKKKLEKEQAEIKRLLAKAKEEEAKRQEERVKKDAEMASKRVRDSIAFVEKKIAKEKILAKQLADINAANEKKSLDSLNNEIKKAKELKEKVSKNVATEVPDNLTSEEKAKLNAENKAKLKPNANCTSIATVAELQDLFQKLEAKVDDDARMNLVKKHVKKNKLCYTCTDIEQLSQGFAKQNGKFEFVMLMMPMIVDTENHKVVENIFSFESLKDQVIVGFRAMNRKKP